MGTIVNCICVENAERFGGFDTDKSRDLRKYNLSILISL